MAASYVDLRVWQEAMKLVLQIYKATKKFPREELYGLTNQLRRAAVSVPSNIAEGKGRRTDKEFCAFLYHARGSLLEVQTQIQIAQALPYVSAEEAAELLKRATAVGMTLNGLIGSLSREKSDVASAGS